MPPLYRYRCKGRSLSIPGRVIRLTVTAASPDDARRLAQIKNSDFGTTVETPRRIGLVTQLEPCRFCKRMDPIALGLYQRFSFPDGISNVCDNCHEKADKPDTATWRDTEIEGV